MDSSCLFTVRDPKSHMAEAYRLLRTNIMFSSVDKKIKTIVVTSAVPGEGKSTVAANFAITLAHADSKVLVIDCDLRKPTIHKMFGLTNRVGLTNILAQNLNPIKYVQAVSQIPNLYFITCGPIPPNPPELIGSERMKNLITDLYEVYDYIILDTPPVGVVTDAALLSSFMDGVVLVLESGNVKIEAAQGAKYLLNDVKANILGVVINKVEAKNSGYYKYYYYEEDAEANALKKKVRYISEKRKVINYD